MSKPTRGAATCGPSWGGWRSFEDSQDQQQAREARAALQQLPVDRPQPEQFQQVTQVLAENFTALTTSLRHKGMKRNSLAATGMGVLRRLEVEPEGFRSDQGRENFLRSYQAVKDLGWTVHRSTPETPEAA